MDKQNKHGSETKGAKGVETESGGPMAMGMAKKMMAQMGQGGGPTAMMQKMMAQKGQSEGKPPMEKMMGMCAEMLTAIRQTNTLAVHATPEIQQAFGDWLKGLETKAIETLADGEKNVATLAAALDITEETTIYLVSRLAAAGTITLTAKTVAAKGTVS